MRLGSLRRSSSSRRGLRSSRCVSASPSRRRSIMSTGSISMPSTEEEGVYFEELFDSFDREYGKWLSSFCDESVEDLYTDFYLSYSPDFYGFNSDKALRALVYDLVDTNSRLGDEMFGRFRDVVANMVDSGYLNGDISVGWDELVEKWGSDDELETFIEDRFFKEFAQPFDCYYELRRLDEEGLYDDSDYYVDSCVRRRSRRGGLVSRRVGRSGRSSAVRSRRQCRHRRAVCSNKLTDAIAKAKAAGAWREYDDCTPHPTYFEFEPGLYLVQDEIGAECWIEARDD